jgi:hypothetical protein
LTVQQYDCVHGLVGHTVFSARRVPAPHTLAEQMGFIEQHSSCVHCGPAHFCTKPLREKPLPQSPALHTGLIVQHSPAVHAAPMHGSVRAFRERCAAAQSASSHVLFSVQHSATVHDEPAHLEKEFQLKLLREKKVLQSLIWQYGLDWQHSLATVAC